MIVRSDIPPGHQATQATHAALQFAVEHPEEVGPWHRDSGYLVVLNAPCEDDVKWYAQRADFLGLATSIFREDDFGGEVTACVLAPGDSARRLCSSLPLALKEPAMA